MNNDTSFRQPITRRDFLKTSTAAASAAAIGTLDLSRSAHAAGSDIIKVGMIGCGGRNSGAAVQALTADKGARLVAMCDIFRDRVENKLAEIKKAKGDQVIVDNDHKFTGFDGYKHVVEASDVVCIANAAKFHPFHAMAAIQAGKHVFVEKPHGVDPLSVKLMQQACDLAKEKKLCIVSGLQSRFHTGYIETVKRIQDGAIGDVVSLEENFLRAPYVVTERKPEYSELEWQCRTSTTSAGWEGTTCRSRWCITWIVRAGCWVTRRRSSAMAWRAGPRWSSRSTGTYSIITRWCMSSRRGCGFMPSPARPRAATTSVRA